MSHKALSSDHAVPLAVERPVGPGIVVFSSSATELYSNVAAHYFLKRLSQEEQGHVTGDVLPEVIAHLLIHMREVIDRRGTDMGPGRVEVTRLVVGRDLPVLLQAFGLSDRSESHRSRIVITMEEMRSPLQAKPDAPIPPTV